MRDKEEIARAGLRVTMADAFETGEILRSPEDTLQKYLWSLCTERVPNEEVRHREIIRALTINHIQMQQHIDSLDRKSSRLQKWVIILAIASLIGTAVQTCKSLLHEQPKSPIVSEIILQPTAIEPPVHKNTTTAGSPNVHAEETEGVSKSSQPQDEKKK